VKRLFELLLVVRLLFPFFDSPLSHLYSDPQRHWDNAAAFLNPGIMGSSDPFLYQLWLFGWRWASGSSAPAIMLASGLLCAAMPYGWYRALREVVPRSWALAGAILIGLMPESISIYSYFMNETLLMALLGFCFWLTLRAYRKQSIGAYTWACIAWGCAGVTRTVALPMAVICMGSLLVLQSQRLPKTVISALVAAALLIPAGLHAQRALGYFAPFGNLYLNSIYFDGGTREVEVDYGPSGRYHFGAPSFYNPTYYPFSDWTTDRTGVTQISIDLRAKRRDWNSEQSRIRAQRVFPRSKQWWEDFQYLLLGQVWPNSNRSTFIGQATLWGRWLWPPLIVFLLVAVARRWFTQATWLLPVCGLGTIALLTEQTQGVIEGRFREPLDAILVAAAVCCIYFRSGAAQARRQALQFTEVQQ
jgi:hypothetical protein